MDQNVRTNKPSERRKWHSKKEKFWGSLGRQSAKITTCKANLYQERMSVLPSSPCMVCYLHFVIYSSISRDLSILQFSHVCYVQEKYIYLF